MKQGIQLAVISGLNVFLVFLFQWYLLVQLGPGIETDALFAGMTIPILVLSVVSGSLMHVLVPILTGANEERLRIESWSFFILVGSFFGGLATLFFVTAHLWIPILVPGFSDEAKDLTIELARIQLVGMVFSAINAVQWASYHARNIFLWPEFAPMLSSLFAFILLIWLLPIYGVVSAAWIFTLRLILQTLLLSTGMGKPVLPDLKSPSITTAWKRIKPLLLGTTYYKTDPLIDRFLLSTIASGSLSLYYFAQQIYGGVLQIINKAIAAPLVPLLSKLHKEEKIAEFQFAYYQRLLNIACISIVFIFLLGLIGENALDFLIGHGNVRSNNINDLWWIMIWLAGVFVGGSLGTITSSSFYAAGNTSTPTRISVISYTVYIPMKIAAFYSLGVMGLAIATSIYYMFDFLAQLYFLRRSSSLRIKDELASK
jgi:putative peptidoglycan lipid II flippase